jgi:urease beta subunit
MEQGQVSVKRSSLSVGKLLMVKEGMAGKVQRICVGLPSEQMLGTASFLFEPGEHQRIAVKMIDFRGNKVVRVVKLQTGGIPYAYS